MIFIGVFSEIRCDVFALLFVSRTSARRTIPIYIQSAHPTLCAALPQRLFSSAWNIDLRTCMTYRPWWICQRRASWPKRCLSKELYDSPGDSTS
jgi:hypothetical protein